MRYFWTRYLPSYHVALVYMLQATEYKPNAYIAWLGRTNDFRSVIRRQQLDKTAKARLLLLFLRIASAAIVMTAFGLAIIAISTNNLYSGFSAGILVALYPYILSYGIVGLLQIGNILVQRPREKAIIQHAKQLLQQHTAKYRIAVVGSYGKTTTKEIVKTVLGQSFNVAATPGNMNTDIGISRFVTTLDGSEDVLVFEYGEEQLGDVARLAELTSPNMAILTGASSAHMDTFGSIDNVVATLREIETVVAPSDLYVNGDSSLLANIGLKTHQYSHKGIDGWHIENIKADISGTSFKIKKQKQTVSIHTQLIGEHLVPVCAAVAVLALRLGMKTDAIEAGFKKVQPFEHRMQPYSLLGAKIIDDTYNGNSEGMKAGLELLKGVKTKGRRIYITPGLVEQGDMNRTVHETVGEQIAKSADVVVLMKNSVTNHILRGIERGGYTGELLVIDDPLGFYQNLDQFVLEDDVVLMQNDWTDNYA